MGCITRECWECGHIDGKLPPRGPKRSECPKCGGQMSVDFDELECHEEYCCEDEEFEEEEVKNEEIQT